MAKRDIIEEIKLKKGNHPAEYKHFGAVYTRLMTLVSLEDHLNKVTKGVIKEFDDKSDELFEVINYIPVGLVACIESFFRIAIAYLIDSDFYYLSKSKELIKNKRNIISFETVIDMEANNLSKGELISHVLSMGSFKDINDHMSAILGENFESKLKEYVFLGDDEEDLFSDLSDDEYNKPSYDKFRNEVAEIFKLRHRICHEPYFRFKKGGATLADILSLSRNVSEFLFSSEKVIEDHLKARGLQ
ncbi:hypothetical protein [Neptunomonas phycophila]|uniref:hypothetical protein n=1 Tax=Neptunomonas phycophila TaxID=1572645 RepID=UPI0037357AEC